MAVSANRSRTWIINESVCTNDAHKTNDAHNAFVAHAPPSPAVLVALVCEGSSANLHLGLWYNRVRHMQDRNLDAEITPAAVDASWGQLASELCSSWNLFAVDLQEEPSKAAWGQGWEDSDWGKAAQHIGNLVLRACPRWLVMVQGVGNKPGAEATPMWDGPFWEGENMHGARVAPIELTDPTKLLYTPHLNGHSTYRLP